MKDLSATICPNLIGLPPRPTLARFLDFWLAHIAWPRLQFTTARTYSSTVVHVIAPVLGRVAVARLNTADIEKAQVVWSRAGVTRPPIRGESSAVPSRTIYKNSKTCTLSWN